LEFGPGFYTTPDFRVAEDYAQVALLDNAIDEAYIYEFEFDFDNACADLKYADFRIPTVEWYRFVQANLHGEPVDEYDFVCGPLENEQIWGLLDLAERGELDLQEAISIVSQLDYSLQVAIKTEAAKTYLKKVDCVIVVRRLK
jgi:hypothetical protein